MFVFHDDIKPVLGDELIEWEDEVRLLYVPELVGDVVEGGYALDVQLELYAVVYVRDVGLGLP